MLVYATSTDLATWTGATAPANADRLLRSASILVARACNRDLYTDVPTTTDAAVLKDATTAQAASWAALGIDPAQVGLDTAPVKSRKIGTADVTYDTTGQDTARVQAATTLAAEAREILLSAGLFALDLPYWTDASDPLPSWGLDTGRGGYGYHPEIDDTSLDGLGGSPIVIEQVIGY